MKINYKITTIVLAVILIVTFVWQCGNVSSRNQTKMDMNTMRGGHMMPDGSMMNDRGMSMETISWTYH